jgi:hypothetical protein
MWLMEEIRAISLLHRGSLDSYSDSPTELPSTDNFTLPFHVCRISIFGTDVLSDDGQLRNVSTIQIKLALKD